MPKQQHTLTFHTKCVLKSGGQTVIGKPLAGLGPFKSSSLQNVPLPTVQALSHKVHSIRLAHLAWEKTSTK